jgi:hypothetical protein
MKRVFLAGVVFLGLLGAAQAQDHANCPMGASHKARAEQVDHSHEGATGIGNAASAHHFVLEKNGGSIRLEASDANDTASRDGVREHLQAITRAFAAGDFRTPTRIHGAAPPGVDVLKERKASLRYSYAPSERGGVVRITTTDPIALAAVHAFLRFQIADHGTGDPTDVAAE